MVARTTLALVGVGVVQMETSRALVEVGVVPLMVHRSHRLLAEVVAQHPVLPMFQVQKCSAAT